jgi:hypothetical protein
VASKQTANLGLNKWEPTDFIKRDEFNANFDKIDTEITARYKTTDFTGDNIITKVNDGATTVKINPARITFTNAVTALSNITPALGTVTSGTLNGVIINNATGSFNGDVTAKTLSVTSNVISFGTSTTSMDNTGNSMRLKQSDANYFSINANGDHIHWKDNKMVLRIETTPDNHYILKSGWVGLKFLTNSYSIQARLNDDSDYADFSGKNFRATGSFYGIGNMNIESTNGYAAVNAVGSNSIVYLRSTSETRVVDSNDFGTYRAIRASSFPTNSSATAKTNIEVFSNEATPLLKDVNIYRYYLQSDIDNAVYDKPKIGMISETVPAVFRDEKGVDVYTIASVLFKVCQEQQDAIESLTKEIDDLQLALGTVTDTVATISGGIEL